MKKRKKLNVAGWTISLGIVSLVTLIIFIKAVGELFDDWFSTNVVWITIVSGVLVLIFLVTGIIKIKSIMNRGKGVF